MEFVHSRISHMVSLLCSDEPWKSPGSFLIFLILSFYQINRSVQSLVSSPACKDMFCSQLEYPEYPKDPEHPTWWGPKGSTRFSLWWGTCVLFLVEFLLQFQALRKHLNIVEGTSDSSLIIFLNIFHLKPFVYNYRLFLCSSTLLNHDLFSAVQIK